VALFDDSFGGTLPLKCVRLIPTIRSNSRPLGLENTSGLKPIPQPPAVSFSAPKPAAECSEANGLRGIWEKLNALPRQPRVLVHNPANAANVPRHFDFRMHLVHVTGWNPARTTILYISGYLDLNSTEHFAGQTLAKTARPVATRHGGPSTAPFDVTEETNAPPNS